MLQLFPLDNFQMEHPVKERNGKNVNDITTQQKKNYFKQKTDGQALKQLGCFQTGPLVQFFDQKMIPQGWPSKLFSM